MGEKEKGEKARLEYSGRLDVSQFATHLESLAQGLRREQLQLSAGGRTLVLQPKGIVRIELTAENDAEKGRGSIEIEIAWRDAEAIATPELTISSDIMEMSAPFENSHTLNGET